MKVSLLEKLDFSNLQCWFTTYELTLRACSGYNMFSIDQGNPTLGSDQAGQRWYVSTWWFNSYKKHMNPEQLIHHMDHLTEYYSPQAGDKAYAAYMRGETVVSSTICWRVVMKKLSNMNTTEKRKPRISCGYNSVNDVHRHWNQMGNRCLITGILYKKGVNDLSFDRITDDLNHTTEDCLLINTWLNFGKETHKAFKTKEALSIYCMEHYICASESDFFKMCAIIRPIIVNMINRWSVIRNKTT